MTMRLTLPEDVFERFVKAHLAPCRQDQQIGILDGVEWRVFL